MIKTISYLGLGTMGSGMAANLLKAGYKLTRLESEPGKMGAICQKGRASSRYTRLTETA